MLVLAVCATMCTLHAQSTKPTTQRAPRTLPNDNLPPEFIEKNTTDSDEKSHSGSHSPETKKSVIAGEAQKKSPAQMFVRKDSATMSFRADLAEEDEKANAPKPKPSPFAGMKISALKLKIPAQAQSQPKTITLNGYMINERTYTSVASLRAALGGKGKAVGEIMLGNDLVRIAPYSFYITAERKEGIAMTQMPYPAVVFANVLLVPVEPFLQALGTLGLFMVERTNEQTTLWRTDQAPMTSTVFAYPDSITPARFDEKTEPMIIKGNPKTVKTMTQNGSKNNPLKPLLTNNTLTTNDAPTPESIPPRSVEPSLKPVLGSSQKLMGESLGKALSKSMGNTAAKSAGTITNKMVMPPAQIAPVLSANPDSMAMKSLAPRENKTATELTKTESTKTQPIKTQPNKTLLLPENTGANKASTSNVPLESKPSVARNNTAERATAPEMNTMPDRAPRTTTPKLLRRELDDDITISNPKNTSAPQIVPQTVPQNLKKNLDDAPSKLPATTPKQSDEPAESQFPQNGRTYKLPKNLKRKELEKDSLQTLLQPVIRRKKLRYLASLDMRMPLDTDSEFAPLPNNLPPRTQKSDSDSKKKSSSKKSAAEKKTVEKNSSEKKKWALDVIVIDPGHGGKDQGASGVNGTLEKDVVLAIGKKLGALLKDALPETKVVFTRSDDRFIELYRRGQIANEAKGKLFISLHCNSMPKKPHPAKGFETYILKPERSDDAVHVAETENAVIKLESDQKRYKRLTQEEFIIVNMMQSAFMKFSEKFGALVQKQVTRALPLESRGVNQAGFLVLVGASMPSVLIETGFLSNTTEEKYLRSTKGQNAIAETICAAIVKYRSEYERMIKTEGEN